jgi:hypothetical protein
LFDRLPESRSTNDLDFFFQTDVLVDLARTQQVAEAFDRLGYTPVESAKYLQWKRDVLVAGMLQQVKIDILVGPLGDARKKLNVNMPRVRPKGRIKLHAHAVEEALRLEDEVMAIALAGTLSSGEPYAGSVLIPQAFTYLMMKLHAYEDRKQKADRVDDSAKRGLERDKERQHAIDLYTIVAMMTEAEYRRAIELGGLSAENAHYARARTIIQDRFASLTATGMIRIREHPLFRDDLEMPAFIAVLQEIFPKP